MVKPGSGTAKPGSEVKNSGSEVRKSGSEMKISGMSEVSTETIVRPAVIEHLNPLFKKGAFANKELFKSYARALTHLLVKRVNGGGGGGERGGGGEGGGGGGESSTDNETAKTKLIVTDILRRGLKTFCERRTVVRAEADIDLTIFKSI